MDQNTLSAKVQIHAHASSKEVAERLTLSSEELAQVTEDLQDELQIRWVSPVIEEYRGLGLALETTLLITIAGSAVSLLAAGIMQEAGKDIWNATKRLVSKFGRSNLSKRITYRVRPTLLSKRRMSRWLLTSQAICRRSSQQRINLGMC